MCLRSLPSGRKSCIQPQPGQAQRLALTLDVTLRPDPLHCTFTMLMLYLLPPMQDSNPQRAVLETAVLPLHQSGLLSVPKPYQAVTRI